MLPKILYGLVAATLLGGFILPVAWKLKDTSLSIVVLVGFGMMRFDLWQSLTSNSE